MREPVKPPFVYMGALFALIILEFARPPVITQLRMQLLIACTIPIVIVFSSRLRWWHPMMTAYSLVFVLTLIQIPIAYNNYSAYQTARGAFVGVATALSIAWVLQSRPALRKALVVWTFSFAYVAVFGITHGGRGPGGFMGDENDLALACCIAFPFAFIAFEVLKGWKKVLAGGLWVIFVVSIVLSFSRGGFVGLVAVGAYCFYTSRRKGRSALIIVGAILSLLALAPSSYIDEIRTIQDTREGTAESRRFLWHAAFNMWLDNPLLGVGGHGSNWLVGEYQPRDPSYDKPEYRMRDWSGAAVHSTYLQLLAEFGLIGVVLYGSIVFMHFQVLRRLRRDVGRRAREDDPLLHETLLQTRSLAAAMVGYLVPATFVSVLHYPYLWYLGAFTLALDRAIRTELGRRSPGGRPQAKATQASEGISSGR